MAKFPINNSTTCASQRNIRILINMRAISVCLFLVTLVNISLCANNKLYATFSKSSADPGHTKSYFELPRTLNKESSKDGWKVVERSGKNGLFVACRDYDYRLCLLVDRKNTVAGVQIASAVSDLERTNAPAKPQLERKTVLGTEVYAATIMFVGDDVLQSGGRTLTDDTDTAPNGLLVSTENGMRLIPKMEEDLAGSKYVKQRCFPGMGRHYFYDYSKESDCDTLDVYLPLYSEEKQELVGVVYKSFGNESVQRDGRPWFEYLSASDSKFIAPDGPDCVGDYVRNYGSHTLHIYTTNEPWNLKCGGS